MKSKITILAFAMTFLANVKASTPVTWSVVGTGYGSEKGEVAWGDFNNDGYLDLFQVSNNVFTLYKNNGNETFADVTSTIFPTSIPSGVEQSMAIFLDYNNDGNLDLLVAGKSGGTTQTTLYKNSGAPDYTFTVDASNSIVGVTTGNDGDSHKGLSAVDYDNDGWVDLFVEGWSDPLNTRVVALYKNVSGTFVRQTTVVDGTSDFDGMNGGSLHTGDINNDGYADVLTTGYALSGGYKSVLYINQANGTFTKSTASFPGVEQGEAYLFDSNHDGWLDVFVAGVTYDGGWGWPGNLYLNNHDGTFTQASGTSLPSGTQGYTAFDSGDINNDGATDLLIMLPSSGNSAVFYNNGDNTYLKDIPQTEGRARAGSLQLADFNNDNRLDYFVFGWRDGYAFPDNTNYGGNWIAAFVKNNTAPSNLAPTVPTNILATQVDGKYKISWDKSTDDITPQNTLRYNIYVKDQTGKVYVYSSADITTGRLKTASATLLYKNEYLLDLPNATYTVGVQAVDQANVASAFATVTISETTGLHNEFDSDNITVNTSNRHITVVNNSAAKVSFSVFALNGKILYSGFCDAASVAKVSTPFGQGVYIVKFASQGKNCQKKISVF